MRYLKKVRLIDNHAGLTQKCDSTTSSIQWGLRLRLRPLNRDSLRLWLVCEPSAYFSAGSDVALSDFSVSRTAM